MIKSRSIIELEFSQPVSGRLLQEFAAAIPIHATVEVKSNGLGNSPDPREFEVFTLRATWITSADLSDERVNG